MKKIKYLDSEHHEGYQYVTALYLFVHDAWKMLNKESTLPDSKQWEMIHCDDNIPRQENGYDCGVFCCLYAERVAINSPLNFTQNDATLKRQFIWNTILQSHHLEKIVGTIEEYSVTKRSLLTLQEGRWLNDQVVDYYFKLLEMRSNVQRHCIIYTSSFMSKLLDHNLEYNFQKIVTKVKNNMFQKNKIILPIKIDNMHWATGVIYVHSKKIRIYDSMGANRDLYLKALLRFVKDSWHTIYNGMSFQDSEQWKLVDHTNEIPIQNKEHDCGVFCCMYADCISNDAELNFSNENIQQSRQFIKEAIETVNYINIA